MRGHLPAFDFSSSPSMAGAWIIALVRKTLPILTTSSDSDEVFEFPIVYHPTRTIKPYSARRFSPRPSPGGVSLRSESSSDLDSIFSNNFGLANSSSAVCCTDDCWSVSPLFLLFMILAIMMTTIVLFMRYKQPQGYQKQSREDLLDMLDECATTATEMATTIAALEEKISALAHEKANVATKNASLSAELNTAKDKITALETTKAVLETENATQISNLTARNTGLIALVTTLTADNTRLMAEKEALAMENVKPATSSQGAQTNPPPYADAATQTSESVPSLIRAMTANRVRRNADKAAAATTADETLTDVAAVEAENHPATNNLPGPTEEEEVDPTATEVSGEYENPQQHFSKNHRKRGRTKKKLHRIAEAQAAQAGNAAQAAQPANGGGD